MTNFTVRSFVRSFSITDYYFFTLTTAAQKHWAANTRYLMITCVSVSPCMKRSSVTYFSLLAYDAVYYYFYFGPVR